MNRMEEVAALFGKKLEERFTIRWHDNSYVVKFLHTGIYVNEKYTTNSMNEWSKARDDLLMDLVRGDCEIVEGE